jgi:hypothetical protein
MLIFLILRHGTAMLGYIVIGFIFPANCAVVAVLLVPSCAKALAPFSRD